MFFENGTLRDLKEHLLDTGPQPRFEVCAYNESLGLADRNWLVLEEMS